MSTNADKEILVLGATGGVGSEIAKAFLARNYKVRALTRGSRRPMAGITWLQGDVMDAEKLMRAAEGCSVIVHAVNPPKYQNWETLVLPMIRNTIAAAKKTGARIILPGTLYNYGSGTPQPLRETTAQNPSSRKGRIRMELEQLLEQASTEGVKVLIVRAGDFFGPHTGGSWFSGLYVKPGRPVRSIYNPAKKGIGHSWAYLPDLAETVVRIMANEAKLCAFEVFHFRGHRDEDGLKMAKTIQGSAGVKEAKIRQVPWPLLKVAALFSPFMREAIDVQFLWEEEFFLDNSKLVQLIGEEPHTPWEQAVARSLMGQGCVA